MKKIAAGIVLALVGTLAQASDWQAAAQGNEASIWIDASSVHFSGNRAKAWFLYNYGTPYAVPGKFPATYARSMKELDLFDCGQGTTGVAQTLYYSQTNGAGDVVSTSAVPPALVSYTDVVPDSIGESMLSRVCSSRTKQPKSAM